MTDVAQKCLIDCSVVEVQPAVTDPASGAVLIPPVLQLATVSMVDLTDDEAAQAQTDEQAWQERQTTESATVAATNQQTLLHQRNRWIGETDAYMLPADAFPSDMPDDVKEAISTSQSAIAEWRQQLRDWPATVADWTAPPALPQPPQITLASGRQLIIVT